MPHLNNLSVRKETQTGFLGYDRNEIAADGTLFDTENVSFSKFPALCVREKRGMLKTFSAPASLCAKEKLAWVEGTRFYYNGSYRGDVEAGEKQFASIGAYLLIFPDKKYFNTEDMTFGSLEATFQTVGNTTITLVDSSFAAYGDYTVSATAPEEAQDGDLWLDSADTPHALKRFSSSSGAWFSVGTTYVKIASPGIGAQFEKYDGVTLSGFAEPSLNGDFTLYGAANDYLVVAAVIDSAMTQSAQISVSRTVPSMDFVVGHENRVWGASSEKHEIYASKLGDPKNFHCFMGISTDSYAATIGSDGDFTGACSHLGYVLFFKENTIHKVYGNRPANFQITETNARGVEKGSEKSLCTVQETLYYKSPGGICAYDGGLPRDISLPLGGVQYKNACGGVFRSKYYLSMQDKEDTWHLFVYDPVRQMFLREDNLHVSYFASLSGELYCIDKTDNTLKSIGGTTALYDDDGAPFSAEASLEESVSWYAQTGDLMYHHLGARSLQRLLIRFSCAAQSTFSVSLSYDGGEWETVFSAENKQKRAYFLPIVPHRCDRLRMRFSGTGESTIYAVTRFTEQGSEV